MDRDDPAPRYVALKRVHTSAPLGLTMVMESSHPPAVAHLRHTALMNSTTATWPEWKTAKPGQRVRMNRTGWTGTVVNVNRFGVRVLWDQSGYEGVVVAPAFDLTAI
jgi:hypothetical protein